MKLFASLIFILFAVSINGQTDEEKRFLDTLEMGGSYLIGQQMKNFEAKATNGNIYCTQSLNQKITILNFWFEACLPCIDEVEALNALFKKFKDEEKFQFLSFTFEENENAMRFATQHNIKYPIITLSAYECSDLHFKKAYPTTIITDTTGKIIYCTIGTGTSDPNKVQSFFESSVYPIIEKYLGNK